MAEPANGGEIYGAVPLAHHFLRVKVCPGDRVVDATCGNGNDTLLLARLVGPRGKVYAFDLQAEAIGATRELLAGEDLAGRVELVWAGHEQLGKRIREPLRAAVFNLGYLPGGDKELVTRPGTTVAALDAALHLLLPGGLLLVVVYTDHAGASDEEAAVLAWGAGLEPRSCNVWSSRQLNRSAAAPYLVLVEKRS